MRHFIFLASIIIVLLISGASLSESAQIINDPDQRQAIEFRCYGKDEASCDAAALHWDAVAKAGGQKGISPATAFKRKLSWAKYGCDYGGLYSCDALGWAHEHGVESAEKDPVAAHQYYKRGCEHGSSYSCNNYAYTYYHGVGVEQDRERALQFFEQACVLGNGDACSSLDGARREIGTDALHELCLAGDALACHRAAKLQAGGDAPDIVRAANYHHRTCFELSDPLGCLHYAVFLSDNGAKTNRDWKNWSTTAFRRACEISEYEICQSMQRTGEDKYWPMAYAATKVTCEIGLVDACLSIVNRLSGTAWLEAAKYADVGCKLKAPELCHNAGVLYLNHPNAVGDPYANAVQAFQKGCDLSYQPSCDAQTFAWNKSQMWRDVTFGSNQNGFEKFMSDLGRGINQVSVMGLPPTANTTPPQKVSASTNRGVQGNRDFQNAINATNNIGTGYNSTCPVSNPYC